MPGTRDRTCGRCTSGKAPRRIRARGRSTSARAVRDLRALGVGSASAEQVLGDRLQLQVRRALVDLSDLGVAIQLLDGVVLHEPVSAVQVDGERRDALGN